MKQSLEKTNLLKLSAGYIVPSIIGMLFISLQSIIDGFFVGRFVSDTALGSINIVLPILQFIMAAAMIIGVGAQSLMAIYMGKKDVQKAQNMLRTATLGTAALGIVITFVGIFCAEPIVRMLGANEDFAALSATYLQILSYFTLPIMLMFIFDYALRVLGKPNLSMIFMIMGALINIVLDYLLIVVFGMGLMGAALATGIAYSASGVCCMIPLLSKKQPLNLFQGSFQGSALLKMAFNGCSEGINAVAGAIMVWLFNLKLIEYSGTEGVIAFTALLYVIQIGSGFLNGMSDGMRPIISYNFGADNTKRLKGCILLEGILAMAIGIVLCIILTCASRPLIRIFVDTESIIRLAMRGSYICGFSFLLSGLNVLMSGYFTSINRAAESALTAVLRGIVFTVIGIFTLPLLLQIDGVWMTMVFTEIMTFLCVVPIFIVYFKKGKLFKGKLQTQNT